MKNEKDRIEFINNFMSNYLLYYSSLPDSKFDEQKLKGNALFLNDKAKSSKHINNLIKVNIDD